MPDVSVTEMSVEDIRKALGREDTAMQMKIDATKHGMRLGAYMEVLNPSDKSDGLDAYGRQLRAANIVVESNPRAGYWASDGGVFVDSVEGRMLYEEFFARNWQNVMYADRAEMQQIQQRALLLSTDAIVGGWERPYADSQTLRWRNKITPPIPLSELIAITTPITGSDYRTIYMDYDATAVRRFRVGESAEIPMTTLTDHENAIRMRKYGRGIKATYEQMRRLRVDKIAWFIQWTALQAQIDKVAAVINVAINGDGNANTAATVYNLLTLDPNATVLQLSLLAWLSFRMQFSEMYTMTTALAKLDTALQVLMLNTGSANVPATTIPLGGIPNQVRLINNTGDGVALGFTNDAATNKILGLDASLAIEHITEIGSTISEAERVITNQTQVMVMTEVESFAVLDPGATKLLDLTQ